MSFWNLFQKNQQPHKTNEHPSNLPLYKEIDKNILKITQEFGDSKEIIVRKFHIGIKKEIRVASIYMDGLVDQTLVNKFILEALMEDNLISVEHESKESIFEYIKTHALTLSDVKVLSDWDSLTLSILSGKTILIIDGWDEALSGSTIGWEERSIVEPSSETVVRGPKDSFTESLRVNVSLIRRRIRNARLRLETIQVGEVSRTNVAIMYIKGIVKEDLIEEVKSRLLK